VEDQKVTPKFPTLDGVIFRGRVEAADALQAAAIASGLVAAIGQDAVQAIMADAFGKVWHA